MFDERKWCWKPQFFEMNNLNNIELWILDPKIIFFTTCIESKVQHLIFSQYIHCSQFISNMTKPIHTFNIQMMIYLNNWLISLVEVFIVFFLFLRYFIFLIYKSASSVHVWGAVLILYSPNKIFSTKSLLFVPIHTWTNC